MIWQTPDVVTVVPASRPAQATTMKMTRETEEERQRQPTKVLHMPASVNIPARCKYNKPKKLRMRPLEGAAAPYRPPPLATPLHSATVCADVLVFSLFLDSSDVIRDRSTSVGDT